MPTYPNAYAKVKNGFLNFSSQEIGSNLISFEMIFEALLSYSDISFTEFPELDLSMGF